MSRMINRLYGRVYGWFDSKEAGTPPAKRIPAKFTAKAKLALTNLEDRVVPATFTVFNTFDSGAGSLRQAWIDANANPGPDTIEFNTNAMLGTDFSSGRNTIALLTALPGSNTTTGEDISIIGPGADKLLITRGVTGALNRPFTLNGTNNFVFENLTISGFSGTSSGGAIFIGNLSTNSPSLTLNNVNISGNTGGTGGAIYANWQANININESTLSHNSSSSNGGVLRFFGTAAGFTVNITNSTLANNTATNGGALSFQSGAPTVNIFNSTISGNSATSTSTTAGYNGGGIMRGSTTNPITMTIKSSIIAGNKVNAAIAPASQRPDLSPGTGLTVNLENSLIGAADTFTYNDLGNNKVGTQASPLDPRLSALGYNGGVTPTMMPLGAAPASQAIGNGLDSPNGIDQTGKTRAAPFDMGAVEVTPGVPFGVAQPLVNVFTPGGTSYTAKITFHDDLGIDHTTIGANNVVLVGPGGTVVATSGTVDIASNGTPRVGTYTFTPPGGTWSADDNGLYSLEIVGNKVKNTSAVGVAAGFEGAFLVSIPPPTATLSTPPANVTTAGGTSATFKVTYTDAAGGPGIKVSTLDNFDVRVKGPNSYDVLATFVTVNDPLDGSPRIATYSIPAAGGAWDGNDNGTYSLFMEPGQVKSLSGDSVPAGSLGSFTVTAPRPTAAFNTTPPNVTAPGGTSFSFDVKYTDYTGGPGIDWTTIDSSDVRVTGPGGFDVLATKIAVDMMSNGSPRIGSYSFVPPGGSWDKADNGFYTFTVQANQVKNADNIFVGETVLGKVLVGIPQTFTVTNTNESGPGSLRQAILNANASPDTNDTIVFQPGVTGTISLSAGAGLGQMLITDSVTIQGPGASNLTIDGSFVTRIFDVKGATIPVEVSISGLTLSNGAGNDGAASPAAGPGGAIRVLGAGDSLSISKSVISNNNAGTNVGGGIAMVSGTGFLSIDASTISSNFGTKGGGIFAQATKGLLIQNSTITGNVADTLTAAYGGGGLHFQGAIGTGGFNINNTTFSGNNANDSGGAIMLRTITGTVNIHNSTIYNNIAQSASTAAGTGGGGIANNSGGTINIFSTVISDNFANFSNGKDDISVATGTTPINVFNSAIRNPAGFTLSAASKDNLPYFSDLKLGLLQNNGGATDTHLPQLDSPLLDKGSNLLSLTTDQRGAGVDAATYPRVKFLPDIGAVEAGVSPFPQILSNTVPAKITTPGGPFFSFDIVYGDGNAIDVSSLGNTNIFISGPAFNDFATFVSVTPAGNGSPRTATYKIAIPGGTWDGSENGLYNVSINPNEVKNTPLGNYVEAGTVAEFLVAIPQFFLVTNDFDAGPGSLREAIDLANLAVGSSDVITFDPTFFTSAKTILLSSTLTISDDVQINNTTGKQITVDGGGLNRVMLIDGPGNLFVEISGLTVTGGKATDGGAGIKIADEIVTLTNMTITGNKATGNAGGIMVTTGGGVLNIVNSTISNNSSSGAGGGIDAGPGGVTVNITNSTLSNNTGSSGGAFGQGEAKLNMFGSTVSGNSASGSGGAFRFYMGGTGNVVIENSTISGNTSGGTGGAINIFSGNAGTPMTIRNSTITANKAATNAGGIGRTSGTAITITIESSIVAGNTNAATPDMNFAAPLQTIDGNNNLIGVADKGNFSLPGTGQITGTLAAPLDPVLGPLSGNGGGTFTHALLAGSPAINTGLNTQGFKYDQRGVGFNREVPTGFPDIGAFERVLGVPVASAAVTNVTTSGGTTYSFTVTYENEDPIQVSTVIANNNAVRVTGPGGFDVPATYVSIDDNTNGSPRTATYSFTPPGGSWDMADNGTYNVVMQANQVKSTNGNFVVGGTLNNFQVQVPFEFIVNSVADDGSPGTLRWAITEANALVGTNDLIIFDKAFFDGSAGKNEILLTSLLPGFTEGVIINGPGKDKVTVSGGGAFRIFDTSPAAVATPFIIRDLTIANGSASTSGGAINIGDEAVTIENMTIQNSTSANDGGGIHLLSATGSLIVRDSLITNNRVTGGSGDGGAINVQAASNVVIERSTLSGNSVIGDGGAIYFFSGGSLTMTDSTVSGNTSNGGVGGGGIYFFGTVAAGGFSITNSTFSGNKSNGSGGGLLLTSFIGSAVIRNSTITGNVSGTTSTTAGYGGGGVSQRTGTGVLTIESTVISGNTASVGNGRDDLAALNAPNINFSAIFDADGFTPSGSSGNNIPTGTNMMLSPSLSNNGGPTQTHAILAGSPLINAGSNPLALPFDQRGPGFPREIPTGSTDIGAVERLLGVPTASATAANVTIAGGTTYTFTVTYAGEDAILVSSVIGNNNAVRVTGPGLYDVPATFVSIDDNSNGSPRTATYSITPPSGSWDQSDNGSYTVAMQANQVKSITGSFVVAGPIGNFQVQIPLEFIVTNADDSGAGSFRAAIEASNAAIGTTDTITFSKSFFDGSPGKDVITLLSPLPQIADGLVINGPGASLLTISGDGTSRVIDTSKAAANTAITISDLTLTGGRGGILVGDELVTLNRMVITQNNSDTQEGGGVLITAAGGKLFVNDSSISNNTTAATTTDWGGGAIAASGSSAIYNTVIINNSTIADNAAGTPGGAISFRWSGRLEVINSTISGNTTTNTVAGGGGIYMWGSGGGAGVIEIVNSTIHNNSSGGGAGGLSLRSTVAGANILVRNSTITDNTGADGGAISATSAWQTTVTSSVVSGNSAGSGSDDIAAVNAVTLNFSAVGVAAGFTEAGGSGNNLAFGTDLKLGPLADNGGPTQTRLPASDSPLVNAGSNPAPALTTDQRGLTRSVGQTDIGSVELQSAAVTVTGFEVNNGAAQRSRLTTITVTFSGPVSPASFAALGDIVLTRTAATASGTVGTVVQTGAAGANGLINVAQPGPSNQLVLTFANANAANETAGVEYGSLADGRWQLAIPSAGFISTLNDPALRRLFGDFEVGPPPISNGTVDSSDFGSFGGAFGTSPGVGVSPFDYDNNGTIDSTDFAAFGARFGISI